jgi:hypothetical protein
MPQPCPKATDADLHVALGDEPGLQFDKRRIGFVHHAGAKGFVMRGELRFGATRPPVFPYDSTNDENALIFQPAEIVVKRVTRVSAIREPEKLRQNTHATHVRTVSPTSCRDAAGHVHVVMETTHRFV